MGEKQEDLAPRIELIFDDERDLVAWARAQAQFLQQRRFDGLDLGHLIEEVEAIGTVYRDQPQVAMQGLLAYWLKLTYATGRRPHEAFWWRGQQAARHRGIPGALPEPKIRPRRPVQPRLSPRPSRRFDVEPHAAELGTLPID
jgi:hypothetical protein